MESTAKKKILLAEDDAAMRRFVEVVLRQAGYDVASAEDGLAAMQLALENDFDAVVADAIMPNMSGYDLCRTIRAHAGERRVPCIILSGLAENNNTESGIAEAFLTKDTNLKEQLLAELQKLL